MLATAGVAAGALDQRWGRAPVGQRRSEASGSSPVRSRYAIGICRLRRTPSFCRNTSEWALAVLGEIRDALPPLRSSNRLRSA